MDGKKTNLNNKNMSLLKLLKPVCINSEKVRLGQNQDGGYVINKVAIENSSILYTYGVGGDTGYEVAYRAMTGNPVMLYDPTHDMPNVPEGMTFHKVGLGTGDNRFTEHRVKNSDNNYDMLLKIDTEGAEYEYFMDESIILLGQYCTGIILEIHHLNEPMRQLIMKRILKDLDEYFFLTHIHGNNWGGEFGLEGFSVPNVMELSFVNKRICELRTDCSDIYPSPLLDFPNRADQPDCPLLFLKHV